MEMAKKHKKRTQLDVIKSVRKPMPPPTKAFKSKRGDVKRDRKQSKQDLRNI